MLFSFGEFSRVRDFPGYWKNYPKDANGKYDKP